eukprot:TRINITY_DN2465_c0_g1_i1.p1 TRINITY_DN2465_c0_g1~~TRINITY_DN2465_c0_g1_i1.p1  ORF type:complete len:670 (+),score=117.08 TRINITY_DN2465_c0_g1_i1:141-2012(+)
MQPQHRYNSEVWDYRTKDSRQWDSHQHLQRQERYQDRSSTLREYDQVELEGLEELEELEGYKRVESTSCGSGISTIAFVSQDYCLRNRSCTVLELDCSGREYVSPDLPTNVATCTVKKMRCPPIPEPHSSIPYHGPSPPAPLFEDVEMEAGCVIQKFNCSGVETKPEDVGDLLYTSYVQVQCPGNKIFGYQAFDLICATKILNCGGSRVVFTENQSTAMDTGDCEIVDATCDAEDFSATDSCHEIDKICSNSSDPLDGVCSTKEIHNIPNCLSQENRCVPDTILCSGKLYKAQEFTGSLSTCESIINVTCGETVVPLDGLCRITELMCNGKRTLYALQTSIPEDCSISRMMCLSTDIQCSLHAFGCTDCYYALNPVPCSDQCVQAREGPSCICPVDREGAGCRSRREVDCTLKALPLSLSSNNTQTQCTQQHWDDHYICTHVSPDEPLTMEFSVECTFSYDEYNKSMTDDYPEITYVFVDDHLAISDNTSVWVIRSSFIDFDSFSDTFKMDTPITKMNNKVSVSIDLKSVPEHLWNNSRTLFLEQTIASNVPMSKNTPPIRVLFVLKEETSTGAVQTAARWYQQNKDVLVPAIIIGSFATLLVFVLGSKFVNCEKKGHQRIAE